jgi:hypothetical protein
MAAAWARSLAVRLRRFWLIGCSSRSVPHPTTQYYYCLVGYWILTTEKTNEMPPTNTAKRLADYEKRYRELAAQLATIGLIHSGTVTRRYTRCATPGCKCHADPPQPHGPYYQWTAKINGKTVTRRLSETEAELYQEWIANDRQLRRLIQQMRQVAAKAAELKLRQAASP